MRDEIDIEKELAIFEAEERARLGFAEDAERLWSDRMINAQFYASERPKVTILFGGLTIAHDYLVEGALRGLDYKARRLDCPDNESLRMGKEFGNRGQCNPTYYTVGNLIKELNRLRDEEGMTPEEIIDTHLFLTASACGPCRFGMYVTEYRKALRDAGYDGFRVLIFQQTGGLKQATGEELGLVLNPPFFIALVKALLAGDVINALGYRLRPYELEAGSVDRAIEAAKDDCYRALSENKSIVMALFRARARFRQIPIDRLIPKPKVSVIGEFWAMTTEGDGNYFLQRFLEEEGAECTIQLLSNLLLYNLWEYRYDTMQRALLRGVDESYYGLEGVDAGTRMGALWLAQLVLRSAFQFFGNAIGLHGYRLTDMDELVGIADDFYDVELRGGEGHTEVAKVIYDVVKKKSHMTVSVKPFGCMPSSGVSDGVQTAVTERYPEAIFCAVETSGDGAVNFYSRVQMYLFRARQRAQEEFDAVLAEHGVTVEALREELARSRYRNPLRVVPHRGVGTAADIARELAPLVGRSRLERARIRLGRAKARIEKFVGEDIPWLEAKGREIAPHLPPMARFVAEEVQELLGAEGGVWEKIVSRIIPKASEEELREAEGMRTDLGNARGSLPIVQ